MLAALSRLFGGSFSSPFYVFCLDIFPLAGAVTRIGVDTGLNEQNDI